jgi:hypothetical protein
MRCTSTHQNFQCDRDFGHEHEHLHVDGTKVKHTWKSLTVENLAQPSEPKVEAKKVETEAERLVRQSKELLSSLDKTTKSIL